MAYCALRIAENTALIQRTCRNPIEPTKNELPGCGTSGDGSRTISFQDELDIVNCLSYLSTYSDKPGSVMALCVEEKPDHQGLVVSIATNNNSVSYLEQGVRAIVDILAKQAHNPRGDYTDDLLGMILQNGRKRLIGRLNYDGCSTAERLEQVLNYSTRTTPGKRQTQEQLLALSRKLTHLSNNFKRSLGSASRGDSAALMSILTVSARIWNDHRKDIESVLDRMATSDMNRDTKDAFYYRLRQLAQYTSTATRLLRYARRPSLFRSVEVNAVHIDAIDFSTSLNDPQAGDTGILNRYLLKTKAARKSAITTAMQNLNHTDLATLQRDIRKSIVRKSAKKEYKAHAEIQLLLHYASKSTPYPPRILKSNKDACFLCDLFVKTHGRFFVPKTHGRVYELWMLPEMRGAQLDRAGLKEWNRIVGEFDKAVERVVLQVASKDKTRSADPRESAIFSLASERTAESICTRISAASESGSDKTVRALSTKERSSSEILAQQVWSEPEVQVETERSLLLGPDTLVSPLTPLSPTLPLSHTHNKCDDSGVPTMKPSERSCRNRRHDSLPSNQPIEYAKDIYLEPGLAQIYTFDSRHTLVHFHTEKIHIEFSREHADRLASSSSLVGIVSEMHIQATWLSRNQTMQVLKEHRGDIVYLTEIWDTLMPDEGVLLRDPGLLIRNGGDLVQLKARVS